MCLYLVATKQSLEEQITNHTRRLSQGCNKLDIHKSVGLDQLHLTVLKELANVIVKLLSISFERLW